MKHSDKKTFWVNAERVMQLTGFNKKEMLRLRKDNPDWWDKKDGRYIYDANKIPESMIKKVAI